MDVIENNGEVCYEKAKTGFAVIVMCLLFGICAGMYLKE